MNAVFADTSYYVALLSTSDRHHQRADEFARTWRGRLVLTDYVIIELGNALSSVARRQNLVPLIESLKQNRKVEIIPANEELLERGLELFGHRHDKDWSLTDCISFAVMQDNGLTDALTSDHHFEQAGFRALLRLPG
jgi:predicted nucleic acid-binding protein